jgi:hypothetical protein
MSFNRQYAAYSKSGRIVEISDDKSYLQATYPDLLILPFCKGR